MLLLLFVLLHQSVHLCACINSSPSIFQLHGNIYKYRLIMVFKTWCYLKVCIVTWICVYISETEADLHRMVPKFTCMMCKGTEDVVRLFFQELRLHLAQDHNALRLECFKCNMVFPDLKAMHVHYEKTHASTGYVCTICHKVFVTTVTLRMHVRTHKRKSAVSCHLCSVCGKRFASKYGLGVHLKRHSLEKDYACSKCPRMFTSKYEAGRHYVYKHTEKGADIKCYKCGSTFRHKETLRRHLNEHHKMRSPFQCPDCDRQFNVKVTYLNHLQKVHRRPRNIPESNK